MSAPIRSIKAPSEGFYKVKGSKFYAYAYPVQSIQEAEAALENLKKQFHDARHVCFAWRIGREGEIWRAYDAGEPSHSAGDPIYNMIRSKEITNVLVVVIRYFGGTKLGIGGLIEAYGLSAELALDAAELVETIPTLPLEINFGYGMTSEINRIMHHYALEPSESSYTDDCTIHLNIPEEMYQEVHQKFKDLGIFISENEKKED